MNSRKTFKTVRQQLNSHKMREIAKMKRKPPKIKPERKLKLRRKN